MVMAERAVLLVEDDPDDVELVRRVFSRLHFAHPLQVVRDGREAMDYLAGSGAYEDRDRYPLPLLVLLDLKLPKATGHEVLRWLRAQDGLRRLPVVMFTSSDERADINAAYDLGINSYLRKPVSFDALAQLLTKIDLYWLLLNEPPDLLIESGDGSR